MEDFDLDSAVTDIGSGLGLDLPDNTPDDGLNVDPELPVDDPAATTPATTTTTAPGTTAPAAATTDTPPAAGIEPPKTWRKEAAAEWANLPQGVKDEVLKREEDMFKGLEQYKADAGFGKTVQQVLEPYMPLFQQYNMNPVTQIQGLMQSHYTLAFGSPEQKAQLLTQVAKDYGIDLHSLTSASPEPAYIPPEVASLQKTVQELQSRLSADDRRRHEELVAQHQRDVEAFAADPKNAYFEDLANDMATLMRSGVCKTLAEAYESALWRNPAVRQKELARQTAERQEAEKKAAEEAAAKARKAASANVKSSPKGRGAAAPLGSMDDTLKETLASIQSRAS